MSKVTMEVYEKKSKPQRRKDISKILLNFIASNGPITRNEIHEQTGIPRTTIFDNIQRLINAKKIEKYKKSTNRPGRSKVFYKIL